MTEELPLFIVSSARLADDAELLCKNLAGRGWMKAQEIIAEFPMWKDRYIRRIAAESEGRILSGQNGYKLTIEATPEEVLHATNWMRSQAREMIRRSIRIARVFHRAATNHP